MARRPSRVETNPPGGHRQAKVWLICQTFADPGRRGLLSQGDRSVRAKRNDIGINGSLLGAALIGLAARSWSAFLATLIVLLAIGCAGGGIRPSRRGR